MRLPTKSELLLSIFSVIFTLILCEFAARYWFNNLASKDLQKQYGLYYQIPKKEWRIQPHHYLNYSLTPHFQRDKLSHNSLGYRGHEFSTKTDSTFRIVCLGGSTTYTEMVNDNQKTYPALLENLLKDEYNYSNIEVVNAGAPGYNSWESLINLEFRVLDLDPDLVIVYHGTNDVHPRLILPNNYVSDNSGRRVQWAFPETSIYDKSTLLRIFRRKFGYSVPVRLSGLVSRDNGIGGMDKQEVLNQNPPIFFERNLKSMVGLTKIHGVRILLATWASSPNKNDYAATPAYLRGFKEGNEVVKKVGKELQIPVYDFASQMEEDPSYWYDGRHVNEKGAVLKAKLFAKYLVDSGILNQE